MCWETAKPKAIEAAKPVEKLVPKVVEYTLTPEVRALVDKFHKEFEIVSVKEGISERLARMLVHLRCSAYWGEKQDKDYIAYAKYQDKKNAVNC